MEEKVIAQPKQILKGAGTRLSRPEDIKFTASGNNFAVSNSGGDEVSLYSYDKESNVILNTVPAYSFRNPEAQLTFPHGLAFSYDGKYLAVTQFGAVKFNQIGDLSGWDHKRIDVVSIFQLFW